MSPNLMHGNVGITDGIYAILSDQDRRERIRGLGSEQGNGTELGDVIGQLEMLLARLRRSRDGVYELRSEEAYTPRIPLSCFATDMPSPAT